MAIAFKIKSMYCTEGGVRVCGIAVLGYFWCGVAVIFISFLSGLFRVLVWGKKLNRLTASCLFLHLEQFNYCLQIDVECRPTRLLRS